MAHRKFTKADDLSGNDVPQSVGPHTSGDIHESTVLQVFEPHQGRDLYYNNPKFNSGSTEIQEELDNRIPLGTYTLNNRGTWEENNFNESTLRPYLTEEYDEGAPETPHANKKIQGDGYKPETWGSSVVNTPDGDIVIPFIAGGAGDYTESNTGKFSVEALPFVINPNNDNIIHLDRYYDKQIDKENYELATEGKINLKLEVKVYGRVHPSNPLAGAQTYNASQEAYFRNFGMNIDIFSNRYSVGAYIDNSVEYEEENDGIYLFKLNWDDGTALEHTSEPKLLEDTVLFEHHYEKPGFYSITGVVYRIDDKHLKTWEKFKTNILLNPSPNYELNLHDYNNFASIGGISKDSAFVKSLYNIVGISPLPINGVYDNTRASEEVIEELNEFDKIQLLNVLGKVNYSLIEPYWNFLSPYQTLTDNQDSYVFGCSDPAAGNYYSGEVPEGSTLIDDGTCSYTHIVKIHMGGPTGTFNSLPTSVSIQVGEGTGARFGVNDTNGDPDGIEELSVKNFTDVSDLTPNLPSINWTGAGGPANVNILTRGDNTFRLDDGEIFSNDDSLQYYDWNFAGWYQAPLVPGSGGTGLFLDGDPQFIGSGLTVTTTIEQDTAIYARFYYQDTIPLPDVPYYTGGGNWADGVNLYNNSNNILRGGNAVIIPLDSIYIEVEYYTLEELATEGFTDFDHFDVHREYYDHVQAATVLEFVTSSTNINGTWSIQYLDENLPYREYTYYIVAVDTSGISSNVDTVASATKFPTPTDLIPNVITFPDNIDHMEYIEFATLRLNWNSVSIYDVGFEGDGFGYYRVRLINNNETVLVDENITDINTSQYVYNYIGELEGYDAANPAFNPMLPPDEYTFSIAVSDGNDNSSGFVTKNVTVEEWEDPDIPTLEQPEHIPIDLDNMWFGTEGDTMPTAPNSLQSVDVEYLDTPWNFNVQYIHDTANLPDPFTMPWSWAAYVVWYNAVDEVWDDIMLGYQEYVNGVNDNLSNGTRTITGGDTSQSSDGNVYRLTNWEWALNQVKNSTQPTEDIFYFIEVNDPATGQMIRSTLGRIVNLFEEVPDSPDPDPIYGCTDTDALNYNSEAEEDDGSCEYPELYTLYLGMNEDSPFVSAVISGASNPSEFAPGTEVTIIATDRPARGFYFENWSSDAEASFGNIFNSTTTIIMPENNLNLTANFGDGT